MILEAQRGRFNDWVGDKCNKVSLRAFNGNTGYDLGDLLTEKITLSGAGAALGALFPVALIGIIPAAELGVTPNLIWQVPMFYGASFLGPVLSLGCSAMGYEAGEYVNELLEERIRTPCPYENTT
ncbi:hypothetical protein HOD38_05995 [archaeon]|jgi:hypothetical protein|nr:hypothetical protein [archaeon]MBT4397790.1 hypothetical protein [archaeon]MBT4441124.1 hypothetical protein [archaeon]